MEARSCNNCCFEKTASITYSECVSVVLVIQHAVRMRIICGLPGSTIFFHILSKKRQDFQGNKVIEQEICVLVFSTNLSENVVIKCQLDATDGYVSSLWDAAASCKPDTQPSAPHQTSNLKTTARNTTGSNHCIILLSS